ncbi:BirA family biotin operon repressor/biotin-[acetyl-CoA-carboxylase] ligase [Isoptericola jiangsuensis]|uniref:biotin--[biotin carboxyl-carrier protein] ligase n=1 Tax=Isoptericola jiangsuensis TaxID=548579 RepID=A0A2A9EW79_9MICO|nr:biotin--[acetyl-CoA-carboxylase] ligase [Isoptericola jiangsuensis]PFG42540.1 BirA family biotin operon repressor/biotin-[acetyl-CoA-carboxylase] ligase [Isoptericola jiangsuensis]
MTRDASRAPLDVDRLRRALLRPAGPLARLDVVTEAASTHVDLVARARAGGAEVPALLVAEHQSAGRGRAGRTWTTPPGAALAASFLVRPEVPAVALGWVPLLTGLAVVRALAGAGVDARVKWPNDVLLAHPDEIEGFGGSRKVAGVLAEAVPAADGGRPAVVLGVGLNVDQRADELPVPTATSLRLAAAPGTTTPGRVSLLVALTQELSELLARLGEAGGDAAAAGIADGYAAASATLGARVRAELAGDGGTVEGVAVRLADDGSLVVATPAGERTVTAGDVHHLRLADG